MGTLRIDDLEYEIDDLADETKQKIGRMQEIQNEIGLLNLKIQELQVVSQAYVNTIKAELDGDKPDDPES
jgi:hypothetical protein